MCNQLLRILLASYLLLCCCATTKSDHSKKPKVTKLEVLEISPPPGGQVDDDTILVARVAYSIQNFKNDPDLYVILLQFQHKSGGSSSFGEEARIILKKSQGTVQFNQPLRKVVNSTFLVKPIKFFFYLTERQGPPRRMKITEKVSLGTPSAVIASSETYRYQIK